MESDESEPSECAGLSSSCKSVAGRLARLSHRQNRHSHLSHEPQERPHLFLPDHDDTRSVNGESTEHRSGVRARAKEREALRRVQSVYKGALIRRLPKGKCRCRSTGLRRGARSASRSLLASPSANPSSVPCLSHRKSAVRLARLLLPRGKFWLHPARYPCCRA